MLNERVEVFLGILIFVSFADNSDTESTGDVSNSVNPDSSVKSVIDSYVLLNGKISTFCSIYEGINREIICQQISPSDSMSAFDASKTKSISGTYLGEHFFGSETFDVSDATGSSLLELDALESLVKVESVVSASGLHFFSLSVFSHLKN